MRPRKSSAGAHLRAVEEPVSGPSPLIRTVIADGHRLSRAALRRLLEEQPDIVVIGDAAAGEEVAEVVARTRPDVVVLDLALAGIDGVAAARRALERPAAAAAKMVLLVGPTTDERMLEVLEAGVEGVLAKDSEAPELLRAVRVVADGGAVLGPDLTHRVIAELRLRLPWCGASSGALAELTPREQEVLALVGGGLSNAEIAERLVVSAATAKTHVDRARRKLGARDRAQLVVLAYETGLVSPGRAAVAPASPASDMAAPRHEEPTRLSGCAVGAASTPRDRTISDAPGVVRHA